MDNDFKKPKRFRPNRTNSLDGLLPGGGPVPDRRFARTGRPDGTMAGFERGSGFYSSNTTEETPRPLLNAEPVDQFKILETAESPKKRRLFSRIFNRKHKQKKFRSKKAKIFRFAGISALVVVLLIGGMLGYGYLKARSVFKGDGEGAAGLQKNVDPTKLKGEGDGRVNILILGKGGPEQKDGPDATDTLLLSSIDPVSNEAALLSVPRDLYVKDPYGNSMKINGVYLAAKQRSLAGTKNTDADKETAEQAGTKAIMDTVSSVLGIPMHYYVMLDFEAFRSAIDTVGGISFNVTEPVYEKMLIGGKQYTLDVKTGMQTFDGTRALAYSRCRHCTPSGSDFDRTEQQRLVLAALKEKIFSTSTLSNPVKLYQLLSALGDNVRTDLGGLDEISRLYEIGKEIPADKLISYGLADPPQSLVKTGGVETSSGVLSIVLPRAGLYNYAAIHTFVRNNLRDSYLKSEDAKIIVLNGSSTVGLATTTSEELKSYGYNVIEVDDAPTKDYVNTYIIDVSLGVKKYTKSYLEKRLGVTATDQLTDPAIDVTGADFVIIVGKNEATRQQD